MLGGGAVGGYVGGHLALHWPRTVTPARLLAEHIEAIPKNGLEPLRDDPTAELQVSHPKTMHLHEVASLAKQAPVDIALRLHEVLRHRMGDPAHQAVSRARRICGFHCRTASNEERIGRYRGVGPHAGMHRIAHFRRAVRAGANSPAGAPQGARRSHTGIPCRRWSTVAPPSVPKRVAEWLAWWTAGTR